MEVQVNVHISYNIVIIIISLIVCYLFVAISCCGSLVYEGSITSTVVYKTQWYPYRLKAVVNEAPGSRIDIDEVF